MFFSKRFRFFKIFMWLDLTIRDRAGVIFVGYKIPQVLCRRWAWKTWTRALSLGMRGWRSCLELSPGSKDEYLEYLELFRDVKFFTTLASFKAKSTSPKKSSDNPPTLIWKRQTSITNCLQKFGAALDMEISPQLPAFDLKAGNSRMALGQSWISGWRSSAWKGTCRLRHFQVPGKDASNWVNFWEKVVLDRRGLMD